MSVELVAYGWFFVFYAIVASIFVTSGYRSQRRKEELTNSTDNCIKSEEITVIVPFRNEESRITGLLEAINQLTLLPSKILFVDDHSDDASLAVIESTLKPNVPYEIISLDGVLSGKKAAIRKAAGLVQTKFTLTWDADVQMAPDYFKRITELPEAEMYVLPTILKPNHPLQSIYELDVVLANAVNTGLAGLYRPIFASGANLLYATESFVTHDSYEHHQQVSSGDDTFLLRDFTKAKADVRMHTSPELAVFTETPQSFGEYIDQRLRWVSKTNALKDPLNSIVATMQLVLTCIFLSIVVVSIVQGNWLIVGWLISWKTLLDMLFFFSYFKRIGRLATWFWIPVYELWFPFYSVLIALLIPFYRPRWKGRKVTTK